MSRSVNQSSLVTLIDSAVRDTNPVTSSGVSVAGATSVSLIISNTLNQAGNWQLQWSRDNGTTWVNAGTSTALAATTNVTFVTGSPLLAVSGLYRITYTASVAPASGNLYIGLQRVGV